MTIKSKPSDRGTLFSVVFYGQEDEILRAVQKSYHYAYILHDMDIDFHYHIIVNYSNARSCSAVQKDFKSYQNCFVECVRGLNGCIDYLTHEFEKDKYHYSKSRLKADSLNYWFNKAKAVDKVSKDDELEQFCDDLVRLCRKQVKLKYMACRYGRDFIKNYINYRDFGYSLIDEDKETDYYINKNKEKMEILENDESLLCL